MYPKHELLKSIEKAYHSPFISNDLNHFVLYNLDILEQNLLKVKNAFPSNTIHTVALKTNPLLATLKNIVKSGFGLETSTIEEFQIASHVKAKTIIYNSVVKLKNDLEKIKSLAKEKLVVINANSEQDLEQIQYFYQDNFKVLLRINPQVTDGFMGSMDVSTKSSKFGFPIEKGLSYFENLCNKYAFVSGIHVHVGSQTLDVKSYTSALSKVIHFVEPLALKYFNIGGGIPFDYLDNKPFDFELFLSEIISAHPRFFDQYQVITEYGRFYHANAAVTCSKIVRVDKEQKLIVIPLGANAYLRECYNAEDWYHNNLLLDANLKEKTSEPIQKYKIGGPLCFGKDYPFQNVPLSNPEVGDVLITKDIGANTFSLWSKHCSTRFPLVLGYQDGAITCLRKEESIESVIRFWE